MKCAQCQTHLDKNAKFCKKCGAPVSTIVTEKEATVVCQYCGGRILPDAKFCNHCGKAQNGAKVKDVVIQNHYVTWNVLPGQLALKIDEKMMSEYRGVRGLYIAPGTRALFYVNGNYVASLDAGKYPFHKILRGEVATDPIMGFMQSVAYHIANGTALLLGGNYLRKHNFYNVVLVKGADFVLDYELENITTQNIRSTVALSMLCCVTDLNAFFTAQLTDRKYISISDFKSLLTPSLTATLNSHLREVAPPSVCDNPELIAKLLPSVEKCLQAIYPYVALKNVIRLTANQKDIAELRQSREQLYIDNEKLAQLQLRNDYLNRAQNVDYAKKLAEARSAADYQKLADDIDIDRLMNTATRESLAAQIATEQKLKTCRSYNELDVALDGLERDLLLSHETVEALKRKIEFAAEEDREQHAGLMAITLLRNHLSVDKERLAWEIERDDLLSASNVNLEKRAFEWSQERSRKEEALRLEQEKDKYEFEQRRRIDDLDLQKQMDAHKMELLKQAQALREQNLQAAHEREMALRKQTVDADLAKQKMQLDTELEEQRLYFGMTAEQIMVANPRITAEAAAAMSKKFEAEALAEKNAEYISLLQKHNEDIKEMAKEQQQMSRELIQSELKHSAVLTENKQQELERVHESSQNHEDRLLSGVQTATTSMSTAMLRSNKGNQMIFCSNCGKRHMIGTKVCDACNEPL